MKLSSALAPLTDIRLVIQAALPPTISALLHSPSLILQPATLSRIFMSHVWVAFGNVTDENGRASKQNLLPQNAYGVVLDIGAGKVDSRTAPHANKLDMAWCFWLHQDMATR